MASNYNRLYSSRKDQMNTISNVEVVNIQNEMEKARSLSPVKRSSSIDKVKGKKIAYKSDLEDIKAKIVDVEASILSIKNELICKQNDLEICVEKKLEEFKKFHESVKSEQLKNAIEDVKKGFNINSTKIGNELASLGLKIAELNDKISIIEEMI